MPIAPSNGVNPRHDAWGDSWGLAWGDAWGHVVNGGGMPLAFLLPSEPDKPADKLPTNPRQVAEKSAEDRQGPLAPARLDQQPAPSLTQALVARFIDQQARQAQVQPLAPALTLDLSVLAVVPALDAAAALAAQRRRDDDRLAILLLLT